jgi:hypothetical protein
MRQLLLLATFAPGLALAIAGRWSDFLIWIGAAAILGWAIAALANRRSKARPWRGRGGPSCWRLADNPTHV